MDILVWLGIAVLFAIIECFTTQLISIWFSIGALVALLLSLLGCSIFWQLLSFIFVGLGLAIGLHPLIKRKLIQPKALNTDGLVGKKAIVVQSFSNGEGRVLMDHMDWKAKSDEELQEGDEVQVSSIHGVTLNVVKKREDEEQWSYY